VAVLRTPDERFQGLQDYEFEPHYVTIVDERLGPLRMHYLDEGDPAAPVVLLLHGEPTWSYLFRLAVAPLVTAGCRVMAPDLVGFGRSDKPDSPGDFSYAAHVRWLSSFVAAVGLKDAVVVGHDWGGLLGLRLVTGIETLAAAYVAANHGYPSGDVPPNDALREWQRFAATTPVFDVSAIVARACVTELDQAVRSAYDAPYPGEEYKAGARVFPALIPVTPDDPSAQAVRDSRAALSRSAMPFLTVYGEQDPVAGAADSMFQQLVPGASGQPHMRLPDAGHNMPEDAGVAFGQIVAGFAQSLPRGHDGGAGDRPAAASRPRRGARPSSSQAPVPPQPTITRPATS
jgi:haloalkane dehalogenase